MFTYRLLVETFKENFSSGMTFPIIAFQHSVMHVIFVVVGLLFDEQWKERTFHFDLVFVINAPVCKITHARFTNVNHCSSVILEIVLIGCVNSSI